MDRRRAVQVAVFTLLSLLGYIWIGYGTVRSDFGQFVILFGFLSSLYILALYKKVFCHVGFPLILGSALLLRTSLGLMTPNLTDDYFRFIWDGLLFAHGYNPYLTLPSEFIHSPHAITGISSLYAGLNSPDYYTVYPPICEFIFGLSAKLAGGNILGNIIIIRLVIILAEFGVIFLMHRLAFKLSVSPNVVVLYAFNPLVIIELTGNLHFEAVMLLFLVLAIYLLVLKKQLYSAISFGLAVGVKLLPLIFLPLLIKRIGLTKSIIFYIIAGATLVVLFLPFYSVNLIPNFLSSLRLYFQTFEFNASLYYFLRWVGYQIAGYNIIATLGTALAIAAFTIIVTIAVTEKAVIGLSLFQGMLMCLTAYFLFATTVHPWYITSLVLMSIFTCYRYPIIWSVVIILSYSAYRIVPYSENLWLVAVEYVIILSCMGYELFRNLSGRNTIHAIE